MATARRKRRRGKPRPASGARERILDAAIEIFAKSSYEDAGLRDIAAAAEVDVAYVHRCFGSKKRLFAAALSAAVRPKELLEGPVEELPRLIAHDVLASRGSRINGLDIILRSMASSEAGPVVRAFISDEAVQPMAEKLGGGTTQAALVAALVIGVATLRYVVGIAPLSQPDGGDLERLLAHVIGEAAGGAKRGSPRSRSVRNSFD